MSCTDLTRDRCHAAPVASWAWPRGLWRTLVRWRRRAVERRQLAQLPRERWLDIARDPDAIRREIAKPFWRP
ncbi:hypothetical protein CKO28_10970 [Rhodovibrio sodomensis]|uniref:DUF1127 domain-containing protein n=1 Tax=Rhodovibrio sodomensis TaxID=1088 RepID=A0ABS1DF89_9PROT|nr:hypothetical protein [Rhodovibrio sodomensis]MBK1668554.1 hypothetical protein [Rhodovibrio sodomensis]